MTPDQQRRFLAQFEKARKDMEALRRLFPGAFDEHGRAIVASAHFPRLPSERRRSHDHA